MANLVKRAGGLPAVFFTCYPRGWFYRSEVEGPRIAAQGFPRTFHILVEIRHRQLSQCAIDRITPPEPDRVALRYRAPIRSFAEQCHDMVVVAFSGEIHEQGRTAMQHQSTGRDEGCLDTMCLPAGERRAH